MLYFYPIVLFVILFLHSCVPYHIVVHSIEYFVSSYLYICVMFPCLMYILFFITIIFVKSIWAFILKYLIFKICYTSKVNYY